MDLRTSDNVDILLIGGLQGAGKSSLATQWFQDRKRINRDEIRAFHIQMTKGRPWRQEDWSPEVEPLVTAIEMDVLRHELLAGNQVVIDNTLIHERLREPYIQLAKELNKTIGCIFLALPFEYCQAKNRARDRTIPDDILADFYAHMVLPHAGEGLDHVQVLNEPVPLN